MKYRILLTLALLLLALAIYGRLGAVDRPPGQTIPPEPTPPWVQWTYCPIHALEGFNGD